ncbi:MAG TPA: SLC13 family permease [Chthoniobacteraceae bacterium]|nr:SLC13 family permease [Chthoniobacteraceae bacterium]
MNPDLLKVLGLLAVCMALFVANRPRMDVVALLMIVLLPLAGVVTVPEALAGFSDPNVILIAALFVVGEGMVRTGVTHEVGAWLVGKAHNSETRLLVLLMIAVAGLGSVMSSTGVVAVFIPVVISIARQLGIHPGRLMMPLSFAGLTSGMMTLVGTPPNMVLDGALKQAGHPGFSFFSFTPIGLIVLTVGVGYMLVARRWLVERSDGTDSERGRRGLTHLIHDYRLEKRGCRLRVATGSPLVGKRLDTLNLRQNHGINIIAIERPTQLSHELIQPTARTRIERNDILLVDRFDPGNPAHDPDRLAESLGVVPLPLQGLYFMDRANEVGMAEVAIPPESLLVGKTLIHHAFRTRYGLSVVGLRRKGKPVEGTLLEEKLQMGDTVLVAGSWKAIRRLQAQTHDFLVLSLPAEIDDAAPAASQRPYALGALLLMVALMVAGIVPNVIAALIACLVMGLFRCIDMNSAYKSIHWQSLILIVGMMPFARALETTGGISLAVDHLMGLLHGTHTHLVLAALFAMTAATGLFISNTATAVLMAPIALSVAHYLKASPLPFAMTVAIAASCAFMTPVSSPVNTLVLGPGRYRFFDFVKIGVPFTAIVMAIAIWIIPLLFPLEIGVK